MKKLEKRWRQASLDELCEKLSDLSQERCENGCGQPYPDECAVIGDLIVIATLNPGKDYCAPMLEMLNRDEAIQEVLMWLDLL